MKFTRLERSVYLDKHPLFRFFYRLFFYAGAVLLMVSAYIFLFVHETAYDKLMMELPYLISSIILLISACFIRIYVRKRDIYPRPSWSIHLNESGNLKSMRWLLGENEPEDRAFYYAKQTMLELLDFSISYEPWDELGPGLSLIRYDLINSTNYCACDVLMFAAQFGKKRIEDNGGKDSTQVAQRYFSYMERIVFSVAFPSSNENLASELTSINIKKLGEYLDTRHFLQSTREGTVRELIRILCFDCGRQKLWSTGWEIPEENVWPDWIMDKEYTGDSIVYEFISRKGLERMLDSFECEIESLYTRLENTFDRILQNTDK